MTTKIPMILKGSLPSRMTASLGLLVLLLGAAAASHASAASAGPERYIDQRCTYEGSEPAACACARETFRSKVLPQAPSPRIARYAAMFFARDALTDEAERRELHELSHETRNGVARLMTIAVIAEMEQCLAQPAAAPSGSSEATPGRDAFLAYCGDEYDGGVCGCLADQGAAELTPEEFDLVADLQRGFAGVESLDDIAKERGVTRDQLLTVTGSSDRLAGAMMSVSLMACGAF